MLGKARSHSSVRTRKSGCTTVDRGASPAYSASGTEFSPLTTLFGGAATDKGTFGEHLRREREMRGVSLDEVSQATRIIPKFLEAFENERWQDLPGGVFNRGFLRSIARYLGLDEESLIAEYAQATNDRPQVAEWNVSTTDRGSQPRAEHRGRKLVLVLLLVVVAAGAGGWWSWERYGDTVRAWRSPLPADPAVKPPPAAPAAGADRIAQAAGDASANSTAATDLELRVEVSRPTDVTISGDGTNLFSGRMKSGENRVFKAHERFDVSAKNSFALILELNGVSLAPVGKPDSPGSVTLTRKDLAPARGPAGDSH